jgi:hypothetical protein
MSAIPCPLPDEMREVSAATRGFEGGALETVDFSGLPGGFGLEEIFPTPIRHCSGRIRKLLDCGFD